MSSTLPPKKEVMLALLEKTSVFIYLDPRQADVVVPSWFKKQPQLVLQVGLNMPVPIRDLSVDDECVSCTLSFNRSPFFCWVPWTAIFALVGEDGRALVWPDDVPPEVAAQAQKVAKAAGPRAPTAPSPPRARLRAVGGAAEEERAAAPPEPTPAGAAPPAGADPAPAAGADPVPTAASESGAAASSPPAEPPRAVEGGAEGEAGTSAERKPRPAWLRVVK
ncbi:MAG TPA: ClpXP protease specificity-enhancing factor SspB [Polyangiaceae bacterium]|nr:ClpXP protease specificity-enhancing factor SspB [Polyangiaceae bacterium]